MNLNEDLRHLVDAQGLDYFGVADLCSVRVAVLKQVGQHIAGFPAAISFGIRLIDSIVNLLPKQDEIAVKISYRHHAYEVINFRLDLVASVISGYLQRLGFRAFQIPASKQVDDRRMCAEFSHKPAAHLAGLGWYGSIGAALNLGGIMNAQLTLFSENALAESLEKVMKFLAERGVKIQHRSMLKALDQAGARVDFDTEIVCFPKELVEEALKKAPSSFTLAAPDSKFDLPLPHPAGSVYFCTGTGARGFIDPISGTYRQVTISDVGMWGRLVNALENIDLCAFPTPTDVPAETGDVHSLKALLESSAKHIWIQPHTEASLPYLLELAAARAGGVEKLSDRPMVSIIACSLTPFRFKAMDIEVILQACEHGIPIHASSLPVMGGTSPISTMGAVLVAGIEVLAMITMAQIIQPGIPVIGLATALNMDMRSGRAVKASPEAMMVNAASAQFFRWLRIPTHTAGLTTDTVLSDGQAMAEHSLYGFMIAAAGANIIGRAGELEAAKTISPIQLIVDNEIAAVLKRLYKGTELSAETMVWQDILSIAPGGHFLETEHTLKHCREAFEPRLFMHQSRDQWENQGAKDLQRRALDIYEELIGKVEQPEISESRRAEMDRIVRKADRTLAR